MISHYSQVVAVLRQAERSLDAVLFAEWQDLIDYYRGLRYERILASKEYLAEWASQNDLDEPALRSWVESPSLLDKLASEVGIRSEVFRARVSSFCLATLHRLGEVFCSNERPEREVLISLRMDSYAAWWLLIRFLGEGPACKAARGIEYFNSSEHLDLTSFDSVSALVGRGPSVKGA